jgi:hypothetical protein
LRPPDARRGRWLGRRAVTAALLALAAVLLVAPAALAGDRPLRIDTKVSLRTQYGYAPRYECNLPMFDAANHAYIRSRAAGQDATRDAWSLRNGTFHRASLIAAITRAFPRFRNTVNAGGWGGEAIEADALGRLYTLVQIRVGQDSLRNLLLYSTDAGRSWRVIRLPFDPPSASPDGRNDGTCASEHLTGWNLRPDPPLIAMWQPAGQWPGYRACRMALYVAQPYFDGDRLVLPEPVQVTDRSLGMIQAAGGASFAATVGTTTYITWAEVATPDAGASPIFVAAYDQTTGTLGPAEEVEQARPVNDDHCTPGIVADSQGGLHVVSGSHNASFMYAHTATPADPTTWSKPVPMLLDGYRIAGKSPRGRQTYVSLVCTPADRLVVVFRQWRRGVDTAFRGQAYDALCVQWLDPGGTWTRPLRLAYCSRDRGYAQYYQKMSIDRRGRVFLSLNYFRPKDWPVEERAANRYHHRMILMSADGGESWRFATLADFTRGVTPQQP